MKIFTLVILTLFTALVCPAQSLTLSAPTSAPPAVPPKEAVNYTIRVEWSEPKTESKYLELLTAEGQFELNTIQKNSVKINNNEVPITLKFSGSLTAVDEEKGRLKLFLGRTVPYVTSTNPMGGSSYSQMNVGVDSTFIVTFGKSQVIQSDENGEISVTVKRMDK